MKGPKCWLQASAGDYKGAQPPYLAEKRPEVALSASTYNVHDARAQQATSGPLAFLFPTAAVTVTSAVRQIVVIRQARRKSADY